MITDPTQAVRRAAEVLAFDRWPDQTVQDDPEVIEVMWPVAHEALTDALDVAEIADVLKKHRLDGRKSWSRGVCICGWIGERTDHETHVAAALHVALTGEKP